jgi:hypothetical protein
MKNLKLTNLANAHLSNKEMLCSKGGCCTCGCGCYWDDAGGSSTTANGDANASSANAHDGRVMSVKRE